jgi:hypothetical protein
MKNPIFNSFYMIAYPITLLTSLLINLLIICGMLNSNYVGLEMILLSLCSISYLIRSMIKTKFFRLPVQEEEAYILVPSKANTSNLFSLIIILSLIGWIISLLWVQFSKI